MLSRNSTWLKIVRYFQLRSPRFDRRQNRLVFFIAVAAVLASALVAHPSQARSGANLTCENAFVVTASFRSGVSLSAAFARFNPSPLLDTSPDGRFLAVSSDGVKIQIIDTSTGQNRRELRLPFDAPSERATSKIQSIRYSRDGGRIAVLRRDGKIAVLTSAGDLLATLDRGSPDLAIRSNPVSIDSFQTLLLVNYADGFGEIWETWSGHTKGVYAVDPTLAFPDLNRSTFLPAPAHEDTVLQFSSWTEDGSKVFSVFRNRLLAADLKTGRHEAREAAGVLDVNADGSKLLISGHRGVEVVDFKTGRILATLLDSEPLESASFGKDGSQVLTLSHGGELKVWSVSLRTVLHNIKPPQRIALARWAAKGKIVTVDDDGHVTLLRP